MPDRSSILALLPPGTAVAFAQIAVAFIPPAAFFRQLNLRRLFGQISGLGYALAGEINIAGPRAAGQGHGHQSFAHELPQARHDIELIRPHGLHQGWKGNAIRRVRPPL